MVHIQTASIKQSPQFCIRTLPNLTVKGKSLNTNIKVLINISRLLTFVNKIMVCGSGYISKDLGRSHSRKYFKFADSQNLFLFSDQLSLLTEVTFQSFRL